MKSDTTLEMYDKAVNAIFLGIYSKLNKNRAFNVVLNDLDEKDCYDKLFLKIANTLYNFGDYTLYTTSTGIFKRYRERKLVPLKKYKPGICESWVTFNKEERAKLILDSLKLAELSAGAVIGIYEEYYAN